MTEHTNKWAWDSTNPIETESWQRALRMRDEKFINGMQNSFLMKQFRELKNETGQDPVLEIDELLGRVLEARHSNFNGIDLAERVNTTHDTAHIQVPNFGDLAEETHRGQGTPAQRGEEMDWVAISPNKEVSTTATWGLNDVENFDFNVSMRQMASANLRYQGRISKNIYDDINTYLGTAANVTTTIKTDTKAYKVAVGANGTFGYNNLTKAIQEMKGRDVMVTHCALNPVDVLDVIHDQKFIDSQEAGQFLNLSTGAFGGLMGVQFMESTQVPAGKAFLLEKMRACYIVFRRDQHVVSYDVPPNKWAVNISGKYAIKIVDPGAMCLLSKE